MIGALLNNRYRLDAQLGRGGMGEVYRAHDTLLDRDVAVKLLSAAALSAESRARLLREARSSARLNHPNVVSVYDAGEAELPGSEGPIPFVVMELVEGPSLHQHPPGSLQETLTIAIQVCAALEHAHAHGLVHRDLKPENVLLAPDPLSRTAGLAKLNDFGLARPVASRLSADGTIAGTVFYLAPELALGKEVDSRADLYALGVMLYELVCGELPFVGDDPIAVISQHLHAPATPPRARKPDIPAGLDALILRLLSKKPEDRPGSAEEVRATLLQLALNGARAPAAAKGAPEAVPGPAGEPSLLDRIVRGRLVAREQELAQARGLWQRAVAGEGQVLLISGEPGIGKTRLVRELLTQAQVAGAWALPGECYAEGGVPYSPFAQIVGRVLGDGLGEGLELPDSVLADLLSLVPALRPRFPHVPPNPELDPRSEQQRLFENVVALCAVLSARAPILLVLEDAHWADSSSLALLRHLARRTRRRPVLIVVTYREIELDETRPLHEVLADLNRERLATRLKLGRLTSDGTRDLLAALFAEEITPEFLQGIYRETEGNPFFIEEVCKALVESGEWAFADGRWYRPSMERLGIPQNVRMAVQSRVGRLPQPVQETLQLAAILGREFEFEVLAAASDLDEENLIDAVETAERAQLIEEVAERDTVTFAFAHTLIPTSLAEGVHTLRRRRLHRRTAAALERLRPHDYEALAHHWAAAGDEERALIYCTRAGERAAAAFANVEAERYYRAALDLAEAAAGRAHLLSELGRVLARQSRFWEAIEVWKEGIALYRGLGDVGGASRLYARSARAAWYAGDTPRGLAICREGIAAFGQASGSPDLADLLHETARACWFNGLPGEAEPLCRQALEMAERSVPGAAEPQGAVRVQAEALTTLGTLPGRTPQEAVAALTRAVDLAEAAGLLNQASRAHHNLGYLLLMELCDLAQARAHFLRSADLSRQRGAPAEELYSRDAATDVALLQGDLASAEQDLVVLRELVEAARDPGPAALGLQVTEALLRRYRGELVPAVQQLDSARKIARAAGDLQTVSLFSPYLVDGLLELGRESEAQAVVEESIALEGMWLSPAIACCCRMSQHRAALGQIEASRALLSEARSRTAGQPLDPFSLSWLAWAEAGLAAAEGRWPEAWAGYEAAVGGLSRAGMRWYRAKAWRDWASALLARGQPGDGEQARGLLRRAKAEFEAMGAPVYAGQIQARLEEFD